MSTGLPINIRIMQLENKILNLEGKIIDMSKSTEEKDIKPYSTVGNIRDRSQTRPTDISTGLGQNFTGSIIWNDSELRIPPYGEKTDNPIEGYNRHSHSRYSGGALDIKTLEIVEYDIDWETGDFNKDCQSLWRNLPEIKKQQNINNEDVEKIGLLNLVFNPNTAQWGTGAFKIDVKQCYLVARDDEGNIELDEDGNEKKALLYDEDETKTNIVWDKTAKCWRFYSVYAEEPEV
jgi:hypothetical protein